MRTLRASQSVILVLLVIVESVIPANGQQAGPVSSPQVAVGELRQRLYSSFSTSGDDARFMPWSVLNQLVMRQMLDNESKSTRSSLLRNTSFANPLNEASLVSSINGSFSDNQTKLLMAVGLSDLIAQDTDLGPRNKELYRFAVSLQTSSPVALSQISRFKNSLNNLHDGAVTNILSGQITSGPDAAALLHQVQDARTRVESLLSQGHLGEEALKQLNESGSVILSALNPDASRLFDKIPADSVAAHEYYERIADVAAELPIQRNFGKRSISGLSPETSVEFLASLGHLKGVQNTFAASVAAAAVGLQAGLNDGVNQLNGGWDHLLAGALNAPIKDGVLPIEVKRLAPFVRDFESMKGMLGKGTPPSAVDLSGLLFSSGVISENSGVTQVASAVNSLMQMKGDFASSADTVLNVVAKLDQAGISIPGFKEAVPLLRSANSIVQAAGPLLALTGFGAGFTAFSALAGLGGGSNDAEQFAEIQRQLSVINAKLDLVLKNLDALDKKITLQHQQVMNALEALGFDVERTRDLLVNSVVHQAVRGPCRAAIERDDNALRLQHINTCNDNLQQLYAASSIPGPLTLKANLTTDSLQANALGKFRQELTIRQALVTIATGLKCEGLVMPSPDIDHLNRKLARYSGVDSQGSCSILVLGSPLLEPGIVNEYILDEQNALDFTAMLGRTAAMKWWKLNGEQIGSRWKQHEIPIADQAIAQQTIVSGDVVLPRIVEYVNVGSNLEQLQLIWNERSVLPENVARYWLWSRLRSETWMRTLYSFAWHSELDSYWVALLCQPGDSACGVKDGVKFSREIVTSKDEVGKEKSQVVWFLTLGTLSKVPMPTPAEFDTLQLLWPSTLAPIVDARNRLLSASSGMEFVDDVLGDKHTDGTKNLLEAIAVSVSK